MDSSNPIALAFKSLDIGDIFKYFLHHQAHFEDSDPDPFIVCENVSVEDFNAFVRNMTKLPISLRFLELDENKLLVNDWSTSIHEIVIRNFDHVFNQAIGNGDEIGRIGSFTASRNGNVPDKEGDSCFGPLQDTPYRRDIPARITIDTWATLAVEIAISQSWASLEKAALWWAAYPGVEYIICIKVSPKARSWRYRLYSINQMGELPAPQLDIHFIGEIEANTHLLTLDARRILAIPPTQPLPAGVNAQIVVDFFRICRNTRRTI
jgi:hypothetical protein